MGRISGRGEAVCDGTQNVKRYRYQFFPIPVPRHFSDTKFYQYRFRDYFPVPNLSDTGSDTTGKTEKFSVKVPIRYRYHYGTVTNMVPLPIRYRYQYGTVTNTVPLPIRYRIINLLNYYILAILNICLQSHRNTEPSKALEYL